MENLIIELHIWKAQTENCFFIIIIIINDLNNYL